MRSISKTTKSNLINDGRFDLVMFRPLVRYGIRKKQKCKRLIEKTKSLYPYECNLILFCFL